MIKSQKKSSNLVPLWTRIWNLKRVPQDHTETVYQWSIHGDKLSTAARKWLRVHSLNTCHVEKSTTVRFAEALRAFPTSHGPTSFRKWQFFTVLTCERAFRQSTVHFLWHLIFQASLRALNFSILVYICAFCHSEMQFFADPVPNSPLRPPAWRAYSRASSSTKRWKTFCFTHFVFSPHTSVMSALIWVTLTAATFHRFGRAFDFQIFSDEAGFIFKEPNLSTVGLDDCVLVPVLKTFFLHVLSFFFSSRSTLINQL